MKKLQNELTRGKQRDIHQNKIIRNKRRGTKSSSAFGGLKLFVVATLMAFTYLASAQEYKISASGDKKLIINGVNKIEIEGTTGSEIIFSTAVRSKKTSERAEGLRAVGSWGLEDNSGIGLSVVETGGNIEVDQISKNSSSRYVIKVPKNVAISYSHSTPYGSKLQVRNVESEMEISTNHNSVYLENITGPLTVNTVHGKIEVIFTSLNQSSPTSINSVHGLVDVTVPSSSKAEIRMSSRWGEIFTDMNIDFEEAGDSEKSSSKLAGTLNGGGVSFDISTSHSNIYLRTKK
jgi:hypothetical protein